MGTLLQKLVLGYYLIKHNCQLSCLLKITISFHAKILWTLSALRWFLTFCLKSEPASRVESWTGV